MALSWPEIFGIFLAILLANLVYDYLTNRQKGSLSEAEKRGAMEPQTLEEYVKRHYPNAYNA